MAILSFLINSIYSLTCLYALKAKLGHVFYRGVWNRMKMSNIGFLKTKLP